LPYFLPHYLGDKCPTFDFLVELVGTGRRTPFFVVQVRATRKAFTQRHQPPRLQVGIAAAEVRTMAAYPAPTYGVAVHEIEERAFVIAIDGTTRHGIASVTTAHELDCRTLLRLWKEVRAFWAGRAMTRKTSLFTN